MNESQWLMTRIILDLEQYNTILTFYDENNNTHRYKNNPKD